MNDLTIPSRTADAAHSRFVQRVRRRHAQEMATLAPGLPDATAMRAACAALQAAGRDLPGALRVMRHLVIERLAVLDIEQQAPLEDVVEFRGVVVIEENVVPDQRKPGRRRAQRPGDRGQ